MLARVIIGEHIRSERFFLRAGGTTRGETARLLSPRRLGGGKEVFVRGRKLNEIEGAGDGVREMWGLPGPNITGKTNARNKVNYTIATRGVDGWKGTVLWAGTRTHTHIYRRTSTRASSEARGT